jgi:P2-related tail formation protein
LALSRLLGGTIYNTITHQVFQNLSHSINIKRWWNSNENTLGDFFKNRVCVVNDIFEILFLMSILMKIVMANQRVFHMILLHSF